MFRPSTGLTNPVGLVFLLGHAIIASICGSHALIQEVYMAQLIVRNIDQELVRRLKLRAARHGRSMEAEHREILQQVLLGLEPGETLKELLLAMPEVGDDTDFARMQDQEREIEM
jgi:plasmid stability protein